MTLRENCNWEELEAHRILDLVRAGIGGVSEPMIKWALFVLGDGVGMGMHHG